MQLLTVSDHLPALLDARDKIDFHVGLRPEDLNERGPPVSVSAAPRRHPGALQDPHGA